MLTMYRMPKPDALIGAAEASRILLVDKNTLFRWVAIGKLQIAHKLPSKNGAILFRRADILTLARERRDT